MKISNDTLNILSSFTDLNNQIQVKPGSNLVTVSSTNSVLANAKIPETFDQEFCIYDLSQFLSAVSMFESPDFDFSDKTVNVSNGSGSFFTYVYADPRTIVVPPKDKLGIVGEDVSFSVSADTLKSLFKAAAVLSLPNIVVRNNNNDNLEMNAEDVKNPTSNKYVGNITENALFPSASDFQFVFKVDNMKFLDMDYDVKIISDKKVAYFYNDVIEYWVALEHNDTYFNLE